MIMHNVTKCSLNKFMRYANQLYNQYLRALVVLDPHGEKGSPAFVDVVEIAFVTSLTT
jgi:hypothetical protein